MLIKKVMVHPWVRIIVESDEPLARDQEIRVSDPRFGWTDKLFRVVSPAGRDYLLREVT